MLAADLIAGILLSCVAVGALVILMIELIRHR